MATAEILNFSTSPLFTATVAIDNFVANLYVLILFFVPSVTFLARFFISPKNNVAKDKLIVDVIETKNEITLERIAVSLFIAVFVAGLGSVLSPWVQNIIQTELNLNILIITILAVVIANIFPKSLKKLETTAFVLSLWMMYIFLAVIGAASNLQDMLNVGLPILGFYLVILFLHFFFMLFLAKLFKLELMK